MNLNIAAALRLYYSKPEIGNADIKAMYGRIGSGTICKMKQLARENMAVNDIKTLNPYTVDTVAAFAAWGLDISKLEKNYKKLQELKLEV